MLARLEHALGCADLSKNMVLVAKAKSTPSSAEEINLVVGYNGSPRSQTALDLTLWIAHQTRLATRKVVTVQVVYVIDINLAQPDAGPSSPLDQPFAMPTDGQPLMAPTSGMLTVGSKITEPIYRITVPVEAEPGDRHCLSLIAERPDEGTSVAQLTASPKANWQIQQFEQADRILWQARTLADEWRGSLKTHLRFGDVAEELCQVAQAESANVLVVGCESVEHAIVQSLATITPCPLLGIPV
jgi:nucleotide-binding universal stress UspA family protein